MQKIPFHSSVIVQGCYWGRNLFLFRLGDPKLGLGTQEVLISHGSLQGEPVSGLGGQPQKASMHES